MLQACSSLAEQSGLQTEYQNLASIQQCCAAAPEQEQAKLLTITPGLIQALKSQHPDIATVAQQLASPNAPYRIGAGDVPIHDIVDTLVKDGYDGYFSIEWEKKWHPELPDCETEFPAYPKFVRNRS